MLKLLIAAFSYTCLLTAMFSAAQPQNVIATNGQPLKHGSGKPSVLDTKGRPLERGVMYFIDHNGTDIHGGLTLVDRNNNCPLFVGLDSNPKAQGFIVTFSPFSKHETVVRESSDFIVAFKFIVTRCRQSTAWRVGEEDPKIKRRFIVTGGEAGYFRIVKDEVIGAYKLSWCPLDVCPQCKQRCGDVGISIENNKSYLALDGPALPVTFRRI